MFGIEYVALNGILFNLYKKSTQYLLNFNIEKKQSRNTILLGPVLQIDMQTLLPPPIPFKSGQILFCPKIWAIF